MTNRQVPQSAKYTAARQAQHEYETSMASLPRTPDTKLKSAAHDMMCGALAELDKFRARLVLDPAYAFEWSHEAFVAAGRVNAAGLALTDVTAEQFLRHAKAEMFRKTLWPERSTSVQSNEMSRCKVAALAELVERVEGMPGY
jgi:hypothetical protein